MSKDPKEIVGEIIRLVGKPAAERLLITAKVSPSTAGKLVRGKYSSEIGILIAEKIEKARLAAERLASAS